MYRYSSDCAWLPRQAFAYLHWIVVSKSGGELQGWGWELQRDQALDSCQGAWQQYMAILLGTSWFWEIYSPTHDDGNYTFQLVIKSSSSLLFVPSLTYSTIEYIYTCEAPSCSYTPYSKFLHTYSYSSNVSRAHLCMPSHPIYQSSAHPHHSNVSKCIWILNYRMYIQWSTLYVWLLFDHALCIKILKICLMHANNLVRNV